MAKLHLQVDSPAYENSLPASCNVKFGNVVNSAILWEAYIDHRNARPVYLATMEGRYLMVPEQVIEATSVEPIERRACVCQN